MPDTAKPTGARSTPLKDTSSPSKNFLETLGPVVLREVKAEIRRTSFQGLPVKLLDSFSYQVQNGQLVISSSHPAAVYLNRGVKAYQMTHLTKARRPIPIITDQGKVVFRTATKASMAKGGWRHPGFRGKNFMERGAKRAMDKVKQQAMAQTRDQIVQRFGALFGGRG